MDVGGVDKITNDLPSNLKVASYSRVIAYQ